MDKADSKDKGNNPMSSDDLLPGIPLNLTSKVTEFFYHPKKYIVPDLFDHEVHLFMHCHLKAYDRTGEGIHMDNDFIGKFGNVFLCLSITMNGPPEGIHLSNRLR